MNPSRRYILFLLLFAAVMASPVEARLGLTHAEWEAKFGKPDSRKVYRWSGPATKPGSYLIMIRLEDDRVTGIQVRRESGERFASETARFIIAELRLSDKDLVLYRDAISDDRKTITILMPEKPESPYTEPGSGRASKTSALMGKYQQDWEKALGKPNQDGFHTSGPYLVQRKSNPKSGKVDWIKVVKNSGEKFDEKEIDLLYESLTGQMRSDVSNPPGLFEENSVLLMTKPKKR